MSNNRKKGFTLVELMIVIVIIGILAAIIIPSVSSAIEKAKVAKLQAEVKEMNTALMVESIFDSVYAYRPEEVETIIEKAGFKLDETPKGYSIWYDQSKNQVVFGKTEEIFASDGVISSLPLTYAEDNLPIRIEALTRNKNLLYIDKTNTAIRTFIENMRNIINDAEANINVADTGATPAQKAEFKNNIDSIKNQYLNTLKSGISDAIFDKIDLHITENFDIEKTMFVGEKLISLPKAETENKINLTNVVFAANASVIPNANVSDVTITSTVIIEIPNTVAEIKGGAFNCVNSDVIIQIPLSTTNIADNSLPADSSNVRYVESSYRSVSHNALTVSMNTDDTSDIVINFESGETKSINNGKVTRISAIGENDNYLVQYLIPSLKLTVGDKIKDFNKLKSFVIRRVNFGDITKIMAVAVVEENGDLIGYKLDNIGYITNLYCTTKDSVVFAVNNDKTLTPVYGQLNGINDNATISLKLPDGYEQLANYKNAEFFVNYKIKVITCTEKTTVLGSKYYVDSDFETYINNGSDNNNITFNNNINKVNESILNSIKNYISNQNEAAFVRFVIEIESVEMVENNKTLFIRYYN